MNLMFIEQLLPNRKNLVLYLPFPLLFFAAMVFNYLVISVLNINVETLMQSQIQKKGEIRFFIESLMPFVLMMFFLLIWVKGVHKQSFVSLTTGRKKIDWKRVFFAFSIWGGLIIAMSLLSAFLYPEDFIVNYNPEKFWAFFLVALILIPIQTSFEEYFFRAYLMQGLGLAAKNKWIPFIVTSMVFGLMHIGNPEVEKLGLFTLIFYIGTGFFLGLLALMDDGIELALGFHAANNFISAVLVTSSWTAFQTPSLFKDVSEPKAGFEIMLPLFVLFPILIIVFSKKYGWDHWRERLTGKLTDTNSLPN